MSLKNSIANCRKSFAAGSEREVFYSKKYNVVIKKSIVDGLTEGQTETEEQIFNSLTDKEKQFFPIIEFVKMPNDIHKTIILKKATPLTEFYNKKTWDTDDLQAKVRYLKRVYGVKCNLTLLQKTIEKYEIHDLHRANLGVCDNRLVILDFGC